MKPLMRPLTVAALLFQVGAHPTAGVAETGAQSAGRSTVTDSASIRSDAVRRSIAAIEAEVAAATSGDWNRWFESLAPFRAEMRSKVAAGRASGGTFLLEAEGHPPLLEDPNDVQYLWEDGNLDEWLARRTSLEGIVQAARWLQKRNIDVIFAPVPKMTEVYADRMARNVPTDRRVAPQVRRLLVELLKKDVEVVDLLPLFQAASQEGAEPLYFADDSHWSPRGQAIAVKAIADRLQRYSFVRDAVARPAAFRDKPVVSTFGTGAWRVFLTPEQLAQIRDYSWHGVEILDLNDQPVAPAETSPVILIGDSFTSVALNPGMSLDALLAHELNMPVSRRSASGGTIDAIKDFAREPALLENRRVVVWVTYNGSVMSSVARWSLPNLPERTADKAK